MVCSGCGRQGHNISTCPAVLLTERVEQLQGQLSVSESAREQLQVQLNRTVGELDRFRMDFSRLSVPDASHERLRAELATSRQENAQLKLREQSLLAEGHREISSRDGRIARLEGEVAELRNELHRRGGMIEAMRTGRQMA